jgi:fatty-acyl-CoA synthase
MQDWPLAVPQGCSTTRRASIDPPPAHPKVVALGRGADRPHHYAPYPRPRAEGRQRLERDGIKLGDRVATLAWNTWRHLEAWYGIMGIGAVYHTLNPRLFPEQIVWIINHAEDRIDDRRPDLRAAAGEDRADKLPSVERYVIVLTDAAHMPQTTLPTPSPMRTGSRRSTATSPGKSSTRTPPPACATPPARRATPRAWSIRTAPTCCTR